MAKSENKSNKKAVNNIRLVRKPTFTEHTIHSPSVRAQLPNQTQLKSDSLTIKHKSKKLDDKSKIYAALP